MTTHVTTHVLDSSIGTPAAGVEVELSSVAGQIDAGLTDADGRLALGPAELAPGDYELTFRTGAYFESRAVAHFYPRVSVAFTVAAGHRIHLHVPLLLSPFAYSTYRGS